MQVSHQTAFPVLNPTQMQAVSELGELLRFSPNEVLIKQGSKDYPFYVIKSGVVRIVELTGEVENPITTHQAGSFTGDVDMLTGRSAVISAFANDTVEAYKLCAARLRQLLNECPNFSDLLLEAFQARRELLANTAFLGVRLIGKPNTPETMRMQEFLYKNHVPHTFFDVTTSQGIEQLRTLDAVDKPLPIVHCNGRTESEPSLQKIADCIGIRREVDKQVFDLVIVGAGPAGLAAAVYASSEGIKTLVIDGVGPGGQAGSSSKIENFIGFPSGISGVQLANRAYLQALKFGTQFNAPVMVESIEQDADGLHVLTLCSGQHAQARCILVATGVTYRQLDLPGCQQFEGAGVYYAATSVESRVCDKSVAVVVGGGNSAGQAAMFLAQNAACVKMVIRGSDLSKGMSSYLSHRVMNHPKIELIANSEVTAINGNSCVEEIVIRNSQTGEVQSTKCSALFIFIGASPNSKWLPPAVKRDAKGFVLTGPILQMSNNGTDELWPLERPPCDLETSVPGILAAGDVRAGTTKRCGFAVGDGSLAVTCVHRYLNDYTSNGRGTGERSSAERVSTASLT